MQKALLLLLLSLMCLSHMGRYACAWRNYDLYFENIHCVANKATVKKFTCHLSTSMHNYSTVSVFFAMVTDINAFDVGIQTIMWREGEGDGKRPLKLLDAKLDGCHTLQKGSKHFATQNILRQLHDRSTSKLPDLCPLKKNVQYYATNVHLDPGRFFPYTPTMKFRTVISIHALRQVKMKITLHGGFVYRRRRSPQL